MNFWIFLAILAAVVVAGLVERRRRRGVLSDDINHDSRLTTSQHKLSVAFNPAVRRSKGWQFISWYNIDDWVVVDLETTGLTDKSEALEICIVRPDGKILFDSLVMPQGRITKEASEIHGLTRTGLKGSPTWPEIHDKVCNALSGRRVLSYNADFDSRLLRQTIERYGLSIPKIHWECVMLAFAEYNGEWNDYRQSYRWIKLDRAVRSVGLPFKALHRASNDALATVNLIRVIGERLTQADSSSDLPVAEQTLRPRV